MTSKILFVDDEPAVLDGFKRMLRRDFEIETAVGGEQGLSMIKSQGPYAVIVSDMRMPQMDGVQFLSKARELSGESIRMVLTGYSDIKSAMDAVNEGYLFRFLAKPCDKDNLGKALTAALLQYRLVTAEKELLENTLMGSIKVLTDVLSLANPAAFGRSMRIRGYVQQLVKNLGLESPWRFEAAAMLSQLGCITLDPDTIEAAYCGKTLSPEQQQRFNMHPSVARDLLKHIPRLEPIAWMIGQQTSRPSATSDKEMAESVGTGATLLQLAITYDDLRMRSVSKQDATAELKKTFKPELINILNELEVASSTLEPKLISVSDLRAGMILAEEIRTHTGLLFVGKGQEITYPILVRLKNFQNNRAIPDKVMALISEEQAKAMAMSNGS